MSYYCMQQQNEGNLINVLNWLYFSKGNLNYTIQTSLFMIFLDTHKVQLNIF